MRRRISQILAAAFAVFLLRGAAAPQITTAVDENHLVTLLGNTRPEAAPANDRGMLSDRTRMTHLQLLLRRPQAQEKAFDWTIEALHDGSSPLFHKWLSAHELGAPNGRARRHPERRL